MVLPLFATPNSIGEINCFLRRVVLENGYSLLTGAESRVTLKVSFKSFNLADYVRILPPPVYADLEPFLISLLLACNKNVAKSNEQQ